MAILAIMLVALFGVLDQSQKAWLRGQSHLSQFREGRTAFEKMTRRLAEADLRPYWDYEYPGGNTSQSPDYFTRQSELHFVSGPAAATTGGIPPLIDKSGVQSHSVFFHGPFGVKEADHWTDFSSLLNGWGYFVEFGDDSRDRPPFLEGRNRIKKRFRFRLMELQVPAEVLTTYSSKLSQQNGVSNLYRWFRDAIADGYARPIAENVLALIISPQAQEDTLANIWDIAPEYAYDTRAFQRGLSGTYAVRRSKHQLPPLLRVTMVVMDETSAIQLEERLGDQQPDFGLDRLFQKAPQYEEDLASLEKTLQDQRVAYRVFHTVIRLRNARWSPTELVSP